MNILEPIYNLWFEYQLLTTQHIVNVIHNLNYMLHMH